MAGINRPQGQFLSSIICVILFPLIPLAYEYFAKNDIKADNLALASALYCFGIGFSSKRVEMLPLMTLAGLLILGYYTSVLDKNVSCLPLHNSFLALIVVAVAVIHIRERYDRHIRQFELFFDF